MLNCLCKTFCCWFLFSFTLVHASMALFYATSTLLIWPRLLSCSLILCIFYLIERIHIFGCFSFLRLILLTNPFDGKTRCFLCSQYKLPCKQESGKINEKSCLPSSHGYMCNIFYHFLCSSLNHQELLKGTRVLHFLVESNSL